MVKVAPLSLHLLMRLGQQRDRLATAVAALPASRDTPLGGFQRPFRFAIPAGREDARPIGEGGECLNAKVDPRLLSSRGKRLHWHGGTRETDVPAIYFPADRHRLGRAFNRARPA